MRYVLVAALAVVLARTSLSQAPDTAQQERLKWWTEARFGMFIHWGIYTVPAGEWNGREIEGLGEWIMNRGRIPVRDYEKLAAPFNPVQFDADKWVAIAKNAGMKYITITSKHHDGFAMYGSKVSPYNIVDATPFHRDPMKELAAACQRNGLKLCFYYSQTQDWHEPDAVGNDWDFPNESAKNFQKCIMTRRSSRKCASSSPTTAPLGSSGSTRPAILRSSRAGSWPISCTCCNRSAW